MGYIIHYRKGDDPARYLAYNAKAAKYYLSHIGRAAAFATKEDAEAAIDYFVEVSPEVACSANYSIRLVPPDNKRPPKVLQMPPPSLWARLLKDD